MFPFTTIGRGRFTSVGEAARRDRATRGNRGVAADTD